ncbi:MAG: class I SAM-dependent methyltransferase [Pseudomonadota bacterium]
MTEPAVVAELERRLDELGQVIDLDRLGRMPSDRRAIRAYYWASQLAYSFLYDARSLHVGLSQPDGVARPEDQQAQAARVASLTPPGGPVLELACGRAMNAGHLARIRPDCPIEGVDLSPVQLRYAAWNLRGLGNVRTMRGDYHDLSAFPEASFETAFVVDALCYSTDKARVLGEIARVLRPGGRFVVFDGYREAAHLGPVETRAMHLFARGMALAEFEAYTSFRDACLASPLEIETEEDLSAEVMPSLRRFEALSRRFLRRPRAARLMARTLPMALIGNCVSGHLFPVLVGEGIASYRLTILRKP